MKRLSSGKYEAEMNGYKVSVEKGRRFFGNTLPIWFLTILNEKGETVFQDSSYAKNILVAVAEDLTKGMNGWL